MIMMRWAAALMAVVALPLTGCGVVHQTLERVTQVPMDQAPMVEVDAPNPALTSDAVVADAPVPVVEPEKPATPVAADATVTPLDTARKPRS